MKIIAIICIILGLSLMGVATAEAGTYHYGGFSLVHKPHVLPAAHIGPVGISVSASDDADEAGDSALQDDPKLASIADEIHHDAVSAHCKALHTAYIERHGLTTPRPLRGYTGCKKWAMDEGYWRARRTQIRAIQTSIVTTVQNDIDNLIHFAVFGDYS